MTHKNKRIKHPSLREGLGRLARSNLPTAKDHVKGWPREHYNADHSPKMQYKTYHSARGVARHMFNKTGEILEPYQCSICGCWHLGHVPDMPQDERIKLLNDTIHAELTVLNGYRHDLNHKAQEILALQTKIEKLETTIWEHYYEIKYYNKPNQNEETE